MEVILQDVIMSSQEALMQQDLQLICEPFLHEYPDLIRAGSPDISVWEQTCAHRNGMQRCSVDSAQVHAGTPSHIHCGQWTRSDSTTTAGNRRTEMEMCFSSASVSVIIIPEVARVWGNARSARVQTEALVWWTKQTSALGTRERRDTRAGSYKHEQRI